MAIDYEKIFHYKQEIQKLLAEHPELRPLQDKIDKTLAGAGSQHNRLVLLQTMLYDKVEELSNALTELL